MISYGAASLSLCCKGQAAMFMLDIDDGVPLIVLVAVKLLLRGVQMYRYIACIQAEMASVGIGKEAENAG